MYVSMGNICLFCWIADSCRKLLINFRLNDGGFIWFLCTGAADACLRENETCFFNTSWSHRSVTIYCCLTNWSCFEIAQKRSLHDSVGSSSGCGAAHIDWRIRRCCFLCLHSFLLFCLLTPVLCSSLSACA